MNAFRSVLILFLLWSGNSIIAQEEYNHPPLKNDICDKIVIGDFTCDNCTSVDEQLPKDYRDEIGGEFTKYRYCNVIERDRLADILRKSQNEAVISSIDRLSPADRLELTKITQAKRIIFGTLKFQINHSLAITLEITNLETSQTELQYKFEIPDNAVQIFSKRQGYIEKHVRELLLGKDSGAEPIPAGNPQKTNEQPPVSDNPPTGAEPEQQPAPSAPETPFAIQGPIKDKWLSLGGKNGPLGDVTDNEKPTPDGIGRFNDFQNGAIYWTPTTGAHALGREIREKWGAYKWETGPLGYPISDEALAFDGVGRFAHFEHGSIYVTPKNQAFAVFTQIRDLWSKLGWAKGMLGYPITDEIVTPNKRGRFNHFERGSIYFSPQTGAHEVHGVIRDKWGALGWEAGILGFPKTDETPTPDGKGRFNLFEHGSIYWSPATGAFEVHGAIRDKWGALGWETGILGYPKTDETPTPDGKGRFNHFEHGSIYWSPATGAFEVHGAIRDKWAALGWETGGLGYPVSDERPSSKCPGCRESAFQHGTIYWSAVRGAWVE